MFLEPLDADGLRRSEEANPIKSKPTVRENGLFGSITVGKRRYLRLRRDERTGLLMTRAQIQVAIENQDLEALYFSLNDVP